VKQSANMGGSINQHYAYAGSEQGHKYDILRAPN